MLELGEEFDDSEPLPLLAEIPPQNCPSLRQSSLSKQADCR